MAEGLSINTEKRIFRVINLVKSKNRYKKHFNSLIKSTFYLVVQTYSVIETQK